MEDYRNFMQKVQLFLVVLLLLCLAPMPYGYYMLVRFVAMIAFAVMAWKYVKQDCQSLAIIFGGLALLFQPFYKIALGRLVWNIVDVAVGLLILVLFFYDKSSTSSK